VIGSREFSGPARGALAVEDASDFLIDLIRDHPQNVAAYGYDVWIQKAAEIFAQQQVRVGTPHFEIQGSVQLLSGPFMDAAWQLCRLGVLRPGTKQSNLQSSGEGEGYSITQFGYKWLSERENGSYVPTDSGRIGDLLTRRQDLFGTVYATRASEAARCYSAHAYYACCAMIGAAAESIVVTAGAAKLGEPAASRLYRGTAGRKALTDAVLKGTPDYVAREFRLHAELIGLWRDQSAHAEIVLIGEMEAFTNMRGLIKFASFAADRWQYLTRLAT